jgi:hypothetical protein
MTKLTPSQRKSLRWCLGKIKLGVEKSLSIPATELRSFCHGLLGDQRWAEIWTIDDAEVLLWSFVDRKRNFTIEKIGHLSDPENTSLLDQLCDDTIRELESYPRKYNIYIELPGLFWGGESITEIVLSESMALLGTKPASAATNTLTRPDRTLGDTEAAATLDEFVEAIAPVAAFLLRRESVYLKISELGFLRDLPTYEAPHLLATALTKLKILLVFAMEIGLLERREVFRATYVDERDQSGPVHVVCHEAHASGKNSMSLSTDMSNFLRGIIFVNAEQLDIHCIDELLAPALNFITKLSQDEHAVGIGSGIEWLLDSLISSNQTISLLQCCIGMEAILGERSSGAQELGTTARLAERYAYLMGHSVHDRVQLREDFRKVFLKRGELVHARKTRLSFQDHWLIPKAQEMLQNLIRKELCSNMGIDARQFTKMQINHLRADYSFHRYWR